MFGTEMKASTFFISIVEISILLYAVYQFSQANKKSFTKAQIRFIVLVFLFLFYNVCSGLFPDHKIQIPLLIQNTSAFGSGIVLACYYFYYLSKEFNIEQNRFFNTKLLITTLVGSFIIGYISVYLVTGNAALAKKSFILFPVIVSLYFCYKTLAFLFHSKMNQFSSNHSPYFKLKVTGYTGIIFMATMPIVVFFGDFQVLNNSLVNCSFFVSCYAFYLSSNYLKAIKITSTENHIFETLTKKEKEIAHLLLQQISYKKLAQELFIEYKTVTKHASNIFKKTNCSNLGEFISKYTQNH